MALESAEFCNGYLRSVPSNEGILTLPGKMKRNFINIEKLLLYTLFHKYCLLGFLYFWGWIFIITTTFIALLKGENKEKVGKDEELNTDIRHAYKLLWDIVKLPSIKTTILFLLTAKV